MFHDDENRALGMSYLNQFVINEDDQFECLGIFEVDNESTVKTIQHSTKYHFEEREGNRNLNSDFVSKDF